MYQKEFTVNWTDMDYNGHMRNTAYSDKVADTRTLFFAEHGYSVLDFRSQGFGPVVRSDSLTYYREIHLLEEIIVTLELAGLAPDGSRYKYFSKIIRKHDGALSATMVSVGGFLDLKERKLVSPPDSVLRIYQDLSRTPDFEVLPSSIKK